MKLSRVFKIVAVASWIILILCAIYGFHNHLINMRMVRHLTESLGWKAGIVYIAAYAVRPFIFFPASIMTPLAAVLFGPILGWVYAFFAENTSAAVTFFVARYFGRTFIMKSTSESLQKYDSKLTDNGFDTVLFLRLVPVFPFDFVNLAAGISGIPFRQYIAATIIGTIPGLTAYVLLGGSFHNKKLFFLSLVCFGIVYVLSRIVRTDKKIQEIEKLEDIKSDLL